MSKSPEYWQERSEHLQEQLLKIGDDFSKETIKAFDMAIVNIDKEIANFYTRFADHNKIDFADAKRILTSDERKTYQMELNEYIQKGRTLNYSKEWAHDLENASTVHRVTRLQALQTQMRQHVEETYSKYSAGMTDTMREILNEGYYRNIYEVQKGYGVGNPFSKLDISAAEKVIAKPWAPDGNNFSDKIWQDKDKLLSILNTKLTQALIRGDDVRKLAKELAKECNVSRGNALRLIQTEAAYFASVSKLDSYKKLGVKRYIIIATLDTKTSRICRDMDGVDKDIADYAPGVTAPPFHPWCRSTTAPHFDKNYGQRAARDEKGKTYYVPANMKYHEWYKKHVDGKDADKADYKDRPINSDNGSNDDTSTESKATVNKKGILKTSNNAGIVVTGGEHVIKSGSSGAIPRSDYKRLENHAKIFYEEVRKRIGDVERIAHNTGFSVSNIKKIKDHMFYNEYNLGGKKPSKFDPDYDMAVSWQRLTEGVNIQEMDLVMLRHELMEYDLMIDKGLSYREAHEITERKHNYAKYVKDLNQKEGLN